MSDIAIRVEHLSKQYHIKSVNERHDKLGGKLADGLRSLFGLARRPHLSQSSFWALKISALRSRRARSLASSEVTGPAKVHCSRSSPASRGRLRVRQRFLAG